MAAPPAPDFSALNRTGTATITQIIDPYRASTNDGQIVRLSAMNIPDYHPENPGEISLTVMKVLNDLLVGKDVILYQTKSGKGRVNRMGHRVAHLQVGDIWVQGLLLGLGLARVETDKETPELAAPMLAIETAARGAKTGLWAYDSFNVLSPQTAPNYLDSFQIVEGTVHSAAINKNRIYLNFGPDWKSDFTVSIAPMDKRNFAKAGIDLLALGKAKVRVRGWLRSYNGPYIEVTHPAALEILSTAPAPQTQDAPLPSP